MKYKYSCEKPHERTTIYSGGKKYILDISDVEGCCDRTRSIITLCAKRFGDDSKWLNSCRSIFQMHELTNLNYYIEDGHYDWSRHLEILNQRLFIFQGTEFLFLSDLIHMDVYYENDSSESDPYVAIFSSEVYPALVKKVSTGSTHIDAEEDLNEVIEKYLRFLKGKYLRNSGGIMSLEDYDRLMEWTKYYFANDLIVPQIDVPIEHFNCSNGNIVYTFHILFKRLQPGMTRPDSLYELLRRGFRQLSNTKISNLKKTKKPESYDLQNPLK